MKAAAPSPVLLGRPRSILCRHGSSSGPSWALLGRPWPSWRTLGRSGRLLWRSGSLKRAPGEARGVIKPAILDQVGGGMWGEESHAPEDPKVSTKNPTNRRKIKHLRAHGASGEPLGTPGGLRKPSKTAENRRKPPTTSENLRKPPKTQFRSYRSSSSSSDAWDPVPGRFCLRRGS